MAQEMARCRRAARRAPPRPAAAAPDAGTQEVLAAAVEQQYNAHVARGGALSEVLEREACWGLPEAHAAALMKYGCTRDT